MVGRQHAQWVDAILFGHQLTLQQQPAEVPARAKRDVRHFGFIVDWSDWEALADRVQALRPHSARPRAARTRSFEEHVKLLLEDPSANPIEIKAYRELGSISSALVG